MDAVNNIDEVFGASRPEAFKPRAAPSVAAPRSAGQRSEARGSRLRREVRVESGTIGEPSVVLELVGGDLHGVTVDGKFFGLPTLVECRFLSLADRMIVDQLGKRVAVLVDRLRALE